MAVSKSVSKTIADPQPRARLGLALVGILLAGANLRAGITTVGPLLDQVRGDLHLSSTTASALISLPLLCFAVFSPLAPGFARRLGLEHAITVALGILAIGIVARSVPWLPALWIGTALLGLAVALINVLLPAVVKRDFPDSAGRVTGVYSVAQSAFAALGAGLAVPVAGTADHGWRIAFGMWAGLALIGLAFFLPRLRSDTGAPTAVPATPHRLPWGSPLAWMVTLFMGLQSTIYYSVVTWWPSIEESHGVSTGTAGAHQSVLQIGSIVGNIAAGAALQRWSRDQRGLLTVLVVATGLGIGGELAAPGAGLLWTTLLGFGGGGLIVLALALFGLRTRGHGEAAALSGMAQSCGYLLAAAGPLVVGAVHDRTSGWTAPLVVLLVILVGELIAGLGASRHRYV